MEYLEKKTLLIIIGLLLVSILFFVFNTKSHESAMAASLDSLNNQEQETTAQATDNNDILITEANPEKEVPTKEQMIFIDIDGAVNNPGVYSVSAGTRIYSIIEVAGGLTEKADTKRINRADFAVDGQKIYIPEIDEAFEAQTENSSSTESTVVQSGKININTASLTELESLNGIGAVLAQRIIDYRSTTKFNNIEDIMKVSGIAEGKYLQIKDYITAY
ncbi:MAG: helix-hairpin-helix domain-containing protein [Tissierellales bacterium]|nr:helix-hairpin-helix domain-containing protein [Tissierellales bacterium]MBN2826997.1 helix-hairpin-helix domain-containing protein [Tissierellales bacterium]